MRIVTLSAHLALASTVSLPAAAQSIDGRFGLGVEVPVLDIRHVGRGISVPSPLGDTTITSVGQTTTQIGLFTNGAGIDAKYGLSSQSLLGARLALRRETSKADGSSTAAHSQLSLLPRFEYYMAPDDAVRPHIGLEAGYERSTTNGPAGVASNLWLIGPTGGVAYFASPNWSVDLNASLYFVTGSENLSGQSVSTSGYGGILRLAVSSWFGSRSPEAAAAAQSPGQPAAPLASQEGNPPNTRVISGHMGAVQRVISVTPELTLTLTTYPITSPDIINFQLTMTGTSGAFAGCESFAMDFGGNKIQGSQTHRRSRAGGFSAEESLLGTLPFDAFDPATLQKGDPELVACEKHWAMKPTHIERVKELKNASEMIARGEGLVAGNTSAIETHDDSVVTEMLLSRDVSLKLEARPRVSPYLATARFISRAQAHTNENCSDINIHADGKNLKFDAARPSHPSTSGVTAQTVEGNLTLVDLSHIAAGSDDEVVDACGQKANISSFNREQTWAFLTQTVALAKRLGVWRGYRAPAAPEPSPETVPKAPQSDSAKHQKK